MKMVFDRPRELRITREFIEALLFDGRDEYWDGSIQAYRIPIEELLITEGLRSLIATTVGTSTPVRVV